MSKSVFVGFRISRGEYTKLRALAGDKSISVYVRGLIEREVEADKREANDFAKLLEKIENADLSKIAEKVNTIYEKIDGAGLNKITDAMQILNRNIIKAHDKAKRAEILIEEFALRRLSRSDFKEEYLKSVEEKISE